MSAYLTLCLIELDLGRGQEVFVRPLDRNVLSWRQRRLEVIYGLFLDDVPGSMIQPFKPDADLPVVETLGAVSAHRICFSRAKNPVRCR